MIFDMIDIQSKKFQILRLLFLSFFNVSLFAFLYIFFTPNNPGISSFELAIQSIAFFYVFPIIPAVALILFLLKLLARSFFSKFFSSFTFSRYIILFCIDVLLLVAVFYLINALDIKLTDNMM
jgi:hypothetical protein